jgi:GntR family phosphonate transport system transcriptional regulator
MNAPFRRGDGIAAWKRIADGLEGEIAAGRFRRGERLPTEAQLAAQHGVNRHTVRRALSALAERGLVRATQGSGTFVEAPPLRYPIGPRTRFSEIATAAGREAWGRLLSVREIAADPALA